MRRLFCFCTLLVIGIALQNSRVLAQHPEHSVVPIVVADLESYEDLEARTLTLKLGPITFPDSSHFSLLDRVFTSPEDHWLLSYEISMVDEAGNALPGNLLHHFNLINLKRRDFLCPDYMEYIYAVGSEGTPWPVVPGAAYKILKGDSIMIRTMLRSSNAPVPIHRAFVVVRIKYAPVGMPLKQVKTVWLSVQGCGVHPKYDLLPGVNVTSTDFKVPYAGKLLGVGGHMHEFGRSLQLQNITRQQEITSILWTSKPNRIASPPIVFFLEQGGYKLEMDDVIRVTATYDNTTGKRLPDGAMGILMGYFIPDGPK
jgi:hypothetical protein